MLFETSGLCVTYLISMDFSIRMSTFLVAVLSITRTISIVTPHRTRKLHNSIFWSAQSNETLSKDSWSFFVTKTFFSTPQIFRTTQVIGGKILNHKLWPPNFQDYLTAAKNDMGYRER